MWGANYEPQFRTCLLKPKNFFTKLSPDCLDRLSLFGGQCGACLGRFTWLGQFQISVLFGTTAPSSSLLV